MQRSKLQAADTQGPGWGAAGTPPRDVTSVKLPSVFRASVSKKQSNNAPQRSSQALWNPAHTTGNGGRSSEGLGGPLWSFQNYVYLFVPGIGHAEVRGQPTEIDFLLLPSGP